MVWVIKCPNHGKLFEEYHIDALHQLELHSQEHEKPGRGIPFLYETTKTNAKKKVFG